MPPNPEPDPAANHNTQGLDGRILIGVCTLNEAENIIPMVTQLRAAVPEADILVVDDNSPDGTAELVSKLASEDPQVQIIVRQQRGLGGAIRHAMQQAITGHYQWFVNLDGDLSHSPSEVPRLLQRAGSSPPVDIVIGSRYVSGGAILGWPVRRKLMSRMVNGFATICLRLPVKDCSGSMRCYRVATLQQVGMSNLRSNGYAVLEELLVRLHRQGATMAEVPITFSDRTRGKSKLTLREAIRSTWQMITMAVKG